ncbi:DEAD/DEAH box helicase [Dethiosulfatarculus sandiegensis]|uniref:DEAD/DEAH box helicase n=1 Tax=Dethiosulfatarculus sandiegensis TaxID=1429043 RepID=UPI0006972F72|nr:DEAD/DEAH box helicase [Dethiosulfatarculus sandiegensis]
MHQLDPILDLFHPVIAQWFVGRLGEPTDIQRQAWPKIAQGGHVLITAPTGSGKTLASFLWSINQLVSRSWPLGKTSVLYVSPLKALNNDIEKNLLLPLAQIKKLLKDQGREMPRIQVMTRSGDTPQNQRRRMLRDPPEILITTPESLNLLLSSRGGRSILGSLKTVILDEIHALMGSKRDAFLSTAVERLVPLSGEFQRIALSATIRPLAKAADFVGGFALEYSNDAPLFHARQVSLVQSSLPKKLEIKVCLPEEALSLPPGESVWPALISDFKKIIAKNKSSLFFVNSRRLAEKITHLINRDEQTPLAYAHHGSLSKELRLEVESKLKKGGLKAIVATSSLELGIDIGELEQVVLVQTPPSVSSALQRIGRAGHQVGAASKGALFPTHARDILEAAVLAPAVESGLIEKRPPVGPCLDVLAQVLVSMTAMETWDLDRLYDQIRTSVCYRTLKQKEFDLVLEMLAGRFAQTKIPELRPKIMVDRLENRVKARKGAYLDIYSSGGVIPDRGSYNLRHQESNNRIGQLDEEFVWEAKKGQVFTLGAQNWRVEKITPNDVFVSPAKPDAMAPPFWQAEGFNRDFHFSKALGRFMEQADQNLDQPWFKTHLSNICGLEPPAVEKLCDFLDRQKQATGENLPHANHLLMEQTSAGPGGAPGNQLFLHTLWGGKLNRPFALALEAAWQMRFQKPVEIFAGNDSIALVLPDQVEADELLGMVTKERLGDLLRHRLENSGFFGARFREAAGRALLLPRKGFNQRMPLWLNRLRSQKLLEAIKRLKDFPILLEAWRSCLNEEFDLPALKEVLEKIQTGEIRVSLVKTDHPSPLAMDMAFRQINQYMYQGDEPKTSRASDLDMDLLQEVLFEPDLRPELPEALCREFEEKRQRLFPEYTPDSAWELVEWVKERLLIPLSQWRALKRSMERDHGREAEQALTQAAPKLALLAPLQAAEPLVAARETVFALKNALYPADPHIRLTSLASDQAELTEKDSIDLELPDEPALAFMGQWLSFFAPLGFKQIQKALGISPDRLSDLLGEMVSSRQLITGQLREDSSEKLFVDKNNLESLLRLMRARSRPGFQTLPAEELALFIAEWQGLTRQPKDKENFYNRLEQLLCLPLEAEQWESEFLPARALNYQTGWLDEAATRHQLIWVGQGKGQVAFCFAEDLDLFTDQENEGRQDEVEITQLFTDPNGRYSLDALLQAAGLSSSELVSRLWQGVWQGILTNDSFAALRKGVQTGFKAPDAATSGKYRNTTRPGRRGFARWQGSLPLVGNWRLLPPPDFPQGQLEKTELLKDRARLLLARYGLICRELLAREAPALGWGNIFRALRFMELSGEVLSGMFFHGLSGIQFITPRAFGKLSQGLDQEAVFWLNAKDPASVCGLGLKGFKGLLPKRQAGNHMTFHGSEPVFISASRGRELTFFKPAQDPANPLYLGPLENMLGRSFNPQSRILVKTINQKPAAQSPYLNDLAQIFEVVADYKDVVLYKKRLN